MSLSHGVMAVMSCICIHAFRIRKYIRAIKGLMDTPMIIDDTKSAPDIYANAPTSIKDVEKIIAADLAEFAYIAYIVSKKYAFNYSSM